MLVIQNLFFFYISKLKTKKENIDNNCIKYFSHTSAVNDMTSSGLHIDQQKFQEAKTDIADRHVIYV